MKRIRKFCAIMRHAVQMVGRTWKSYALLSVTIVLSFSLLLGYLTFSDSTIYNENKALFSYRRQDLQFYISEPEVEEIQLLVDNLSAMENTAYYLAFTYSLGQLGGNMVVRPDPNVESDRSLNPYVHGIMLPDHSWPEDVIGYFSRDKRMNIVWLDGQPHVDFTLEKDEVILTEALYRLLEMDQQEAPVFQLDIQYGQKIPLRVVGYTKDFTSEMWQYLHKNTTSQWYADEAMFYIFLSNKFVEYAQLYNPDYYDNFWGGSYAPKLWEIYLQVYSETPEAVVSLLETMGLRNYVSIYQRQNEALDAIRPQKQIKAIITCALLLLLGINLYSSFTNAMNDRKYEIGVKRAVGASAWSIVRQFLYESFIVMAVNILLSISLVADVAVIYKYIVEHTPDETGAYPDFILYISPYSAAMFGICALSLTVVFSLIFAYKSTRVEIVQYLKAE